MAVAYRYADDVRQSTVRYPFGTIASGRRPQVNDIAILAIFGTHSISGDTSGATWNFIGTQNSTSVYWSRVSTAHTAQRQVDIGTAIGHISVYSGVRVTGNPYSQVVSDAPGGSAVSTVLGGLSGYDTTNAFLVGILGRMGDIEASSTATFSGITGGTSTKVSGNFATGGAGGTPFVAFIDGSSGTSPASVTFNHTNQGTRGAFLFDLTDAASTTRVTTTTESSWTTYGTPAAASIVGTTGDNIGGTTTRTVDYPAGTANNDVVFFIANSVTGSISPTLSFSDAGWSAVDNYNSAPYDTTAYWRRVVGTPTSTTVTFSAATFANLNMVTIRDIDPAATTPWVTKSITYKDSASKFYSASVAVADSDQRNFLVLSGRLPGGNVASDTITWANVTGGTADTRKQGTTDGSMVMSLITGTSVTDPVSVTHDWTASSVGVGSNPATALLLNLAVLVLVEPTDSVELFVDTAWDTAETATTSAATSWDTKSVVSTTKSAGTWAVRTGVQATKTSSWTVRTSVPAATKNTLWSTRSLTTKVTATSWATASRVTTSKLSAWSVRTSVTPATKSTTWATNARTVVSKATSWTVFSPANTTKSTTWRVSQAAIPGQVTLLNSTPAIISNNASGNVSVTSSTFLTEDNAFLVAYIESSSTSATPQTHFMSDSTGLTWTQFAMKQPDSPRGGGAVSVWYASVPTFRAMNVTASRTGGGGLGFTLKVFALVNVNASDPFGSSTSGVVYGLPNSSNTVSIDLTPSVTNSIVFFGATVNLENPSDPLVSTSLTHYENWRGSSGEGAVGYQTVYSAPSNIAVTFDGGSITNFTSPWNYIALELKPVPVSVPVSKTVTTSWSTKQSITATKSASWDTYTAVSPKTVSTAWSVELAKVLLELSTSWNTRAVVETGSATSWDTYSAVGKKTQSTAWSVFLSASLTKSTTWSVAQSLIERFSTSWRVLPLPWDGSVPDATVRVSALYSEVVLGDTIDIVRVGGTHQIVAAPILEESH